jgi:periodic tryptophan protein 2
MSSEFKINAVLGMLYTGGNVAFTPDGRRLLSPAASYIASTPLRDEGAQSLPCCNSAIQCFDISPDGDLLFVVGSRGLAFFFSIPSRLCLDTVSLPPTCVVHCVRFSPCAKFVAVALENTLQVYNTPATRTVSFHACHRIENVHAALALPIRSIDWTHDSCHLLLAGEDARMKILPRDVRNKKGLAAAHNLLVGHRQGVVGAWFTSDAGTSVVSVSTDNVVMVWKRTSVTRKELLRFIAESSLAARLKEDPTASSSDNEGDDDHQQDASKVRPSFLERQKKEVLAETGVRISDASDVHLPDILKYGFEVERKHLLQHKGNVTTACFHRARNLLAVGYTTGIFAIHASAAVDLTLVHLLSISTQSLNASSFSPSGDLVAFGSAHLKQLLVWDWKSEVYALKEQSHYYDISCTAITADGSHVISGGEDGKAKVWKVGSGQCIVTFTEHTAAITSVAVSNATNAFFTSSRDGTIRGYDLVRYRNFRIYTNPDQASQFSCVAVDPSGEILAAGSVTSNTITMFSVQTGRVADVLQGHEGPVSCLAFHPGGTTLVSSALDKTVIYWDVFSDGSGGERLKNDGEVVQQPSEVLCIAYSLTGKRMATLSMLQEVCIFDTVVPNEPELIISFKVKADAAGGWDSKNTGPNSANANARFTTIAFAPDGETLVAGGESRWIVMYNASQGYAVKKWPVTNNLDVQGAEEQFKWQQQSEAGNVNSIDIEDDDIHLRQRKALELPGSRHRHHATGKRKTELACRTSHISFASHGTEFAASTSDGLLIFSSAAASGRMFRPLQLDAAITEGRVRELLASGQFALALVSALLLRDKLLVVEAMRRTPAASIPVAIAGIPSQAFPDLVRWIADEVEASPALQHSLLWAQAVVLFSREPLAGYAKSAETTPALKSLHRSLQAHHQLTVMARESTFALRYLVNSSRTMPPGARITAAAPAES